MSTHSLKIVLATILAGVTSATFLVSFLRQQGIVSLHETTLIRR